MSRSESSKQKTLRKHIENSKRYTSRTLLLALKKEAEEESRKKKEEERKKPASFLPSIHRPRKTPSYRKSRRLYSIQREIVTKVEQPEMILPSLPPRGEGIRRRNKTHKRKTS
jgi:hypothetical protein